MCQSCCYSCLFKWTVLHAFEMGRVDPGRGGPIIEHLPNRPPTLSPEGDTSQYGPRDAVLLDGNFMHAITRLRGQASTPQLLRHSHITFTFTFTFTFNRWRPHNRLTPKRIVAGELLQLVAG